MEDVSSVIVAECKYYARRVGIGTVDELYGKLVDVGAEHGVLCAPNGFTSGARSRAGSARRPKIALYDLTGDEELDLDDFPGPDCPADGCDWGWLSWGVGESSSGEVIGLGRCDSCGSLAVRCESCGYELSADGTDECASEYSFESAWWHDGGEWVDRIRNSDDSTEATRFDWASPSRSESDLAADDL